jgi:hypothetical protein
MRIVTALLTLGVDGGVGRHGRGLVGCVNEFAEHEKRERE